MTKDQIKGLAEWLDGIDSHGVYTESLLHELEKFGITLFHDAKGHALLSTDGGKTSIEAPVRTTAQTRTAMRKRGLGGSLDPKAGSNVSGFELADSLCELLKLKSAGGFYSGRGRRFRACVDAIRALSLG